MRLFLLDVVFQRGTRSLDSSVAAFRSPSVRRCWVGTRSRSRVARSPAHDRLKLNLVPLIKNDEILLELTVERLQGFIYFVLWTDLFNYFLLWSRNGLSRAKLLDGQPREISTNESKCFFVSSRDFKVKVQTNNEWKK